LVELRRLIFHLLVSMYQSCTQYHALTLFHTASQVYASAEGLFGLLAEELKKYQDWVVLGGAGDLDEYVDMNLVEVL